MNNKKCPECDGWLDEAFLHAPRGIYWDTKEHKHHIYTCETLMSLWSWTIPRVKAYRCKECNLVIFHYLKGN